MNSSVAKRKNILISVGTNLVLVLLAIFVFGIRYATDDDISIARIAYGIWFVPTARVFFSNVVFGWMLKVLGLILPGINWQLIFYLVLVFSGGICSLYYVLNLEKKETVMAWVLGVLSFYYVGYVRLNFSIVSSMLAFFGYIPVFLGVKEAKKTPVVLGSILLAFSVMIRYESFFAVSAFAGVCFILYVVEEIKAAGFRRIFKQHFIPFIIVMAVMFSLVAVDKLAFSSGVWADYVKYNNYRAQILDYRSLFAAKDEQYFADLGITNEMKTSIQKWQFNDPEMLGMEVFEKLSEDTAKLNPKITSSYLFGLIGYVIEKTFKHYYFLFAFILLFASTAVYQNKGKGEIKIKLIPWLLFVPFFLELSVYNYIGRDINRVLQTTGIGLWTGVFLLQSMGYLEIEKKKSYKNIVGVLMVLVLAFQAKELSNIERIGLVDYKSVEKECDFLQDGRIYMCDNNSIRQIEDKYGIWQVPSPGKFYNCIELGGWLVNYPQVLERQEALGVENPYKSLIDNENVYLLTTGDGTLQKEYLESAYKTEIESELLEVHGGIYVYKFRERL